MRLVFFLSAAILCGPGLTMSRASTLVQAGTGVFEGAPQLNGVRLSGLTFGVGVEVTGGGSADGTFEATLRGRTSAGASIDITVEGTISAGSVGPSGVVSLSGLSVVDPGDGSGPFTGVALAVEVTPNSEGEGTMVLHIGATNLTAAIATGGGITSSSCIAPELGPSLKFQDRDSIQWSGSAAASSYNLYRGPMSGGPWTFDHSCLAPGLTTSSASDATLPPPGGGLYYLVSLKNACGEGALGVTTDGPQIPNPSACP